MSLLKSVIPMLFHYFGIWCLIMRVAAGLDKRPLIGVFSFHWILDGEPDPRSLQAYERGQSLDVFRRQIDVIRSYSSVLALDEFSQMVSGQARPASMRPLALLTLGDADSDHRCLAFKRLAEPGLPDVCFVPTGFIGNGRPLYHCRLTSIIAKVRNSDFLAILELELPNDIQAMLQELGPDFEHHRHEIRRRLTAPFHRLHPRHRDEILESWEQPAGAGYDLGIRCMTRSEIQGLPEQGIAVGSHTVNHNRLELLDREEIRTEVIQFKQVLEERLDAPITSMAFPKVRSTRRPARPPVKQGAGSDSVVPMYWLIIRVPTRDMFTIPTVGVGYDPKWRIAYSFGTETLKPLLSLLLRTKTRLPNRQLARL